MGVGKKCIFLFYKKAVLSIIILLSVGLEEIKNHACTYLREMKKKSAGVVEGPLLEGRYGALTSPHLNLALLRSGAGMERVKKSNERSRVVFKKSRSA